MKVIIYQRPGDGGVSIITPNENFGTVEDVARKDVPEGCLYEIVDSSILPESREHRGAWQLVYKGTGKKRIFSIEIDKAKAKAIDKERAESEVRAIDQSGAGVIDLMLKSGSMSETDLDSNQKALVTRRRELKKKLEDLQ